MFKRIGTAFTAALLTLGVASADVTAQEEIEVYAEVIAVDRDEKSVQVEMEETGAVRTFYLEQETDVTLGGLPYALPLETLDHVHTGDRIRLEFYEEPQGTRLTGFSSDRPATDTASTTVVVETTTTAEPVTPVTPVEPVVETVEPETERAEELPSTSVPSWMYMLAMSAGLVGLAATLRFNRAAATRTGRS